VRGEAALGWHVLRGLVLGLALHGLIGIALLAAGVRVWPGWLPLLVAVAACVAVAGARRAGPPASPTVGPASGAAAPTRRLETAPRWLRLLVLGALAVTFAALVQGAIATPARHWDGFTSWEMRARVLEEAPTLRQPFFADPAVFAHSRDYPLLQPLWQASTAALTGSGGRVLFPLLWLLVVGIAGSAVRRAGLPPIHAWLAAAGLGLMPMLVSPTSGAVDSGYAECALLLALTAAAAAILVGDGVLLGAACVLAVLLKPEGTVYALAITACVFWRGPRPLLVGAAIGTGLALATWLPAWTFLDLGPAAAAQVSPLPRWIVLTLAAALVIALACWLGERSRLWLLLAVAALAVAAVGVVAGIGDAGPGALGSYAANLRRLPQRAARLPALLAALFAQATSVQRFGLLLPLVAVAVCRRDRAAVDAGTRTLTAMLALGMVVVGGSMLLSPEPDFDHHVRSSLDRLLLQWTGVATLCTAGWLRPGSGAAVEAKNVGTSGHEPVPARTAGIPAP